MTTYSAEVLADAPDAYYRLNQTGSGAGAFVDDANGHNVTPNATIVQSVSLIGEPDASATFDHTTAFWQASLAYDASQNPTTVEFWVNPVSLTAGGAQLYNVIAADCTSGGGRGWNAGYRTNGVWTLIYSGVAVYEFTLATPIATVGVTNHVVFVVNGAATDLYIDGSFTQSLATGTMLTGGGAQIILGGIQLASVNYAPRAVADEIAIYKSALSAGRIAAHFSAGRRVQVAVNYPRPRGGRVRA